MSAPSEVTQKQLDELHIAIVKPPGLTCKSGIKETDRISAFRLFFPLSGIIPRIPPS